MTTLNLLPDSYIKQRARYRIELLCVVLFAVVMGSIMVAETISRRELETLHSTYVQVNKEFNQASDQIDEFFAKRVTKAELGNEVGLAAQMQERVPHSYLLALIANARGNSVSLTRISNMDRKEVPVSGEAGERRRVDRSRGKDEPPPKMKTIITTNIQGVADRDDDIARFVTALRENPVVESARWKYSRETKVGNIAVRTFEIEMIFQTDIDVLKLLSGEVGIKPSATQPTTRRAPTTSASDVPPLAVPEEVGRDVSDLPQPGQDFGGGRP